MARRWTDQRIEQVVGGLLRTGVAVAAAVVLAGGVLFLVRHGAEQPHYGVFHGEPSDLRSVRGIVADVASGRARGLIQLGLLLLVATPVARVVFSVAGFALEHDRTYVWITLAVLAVLLFSLAGGHL
ncbi:MAG TPA: DUF1634 domain-containing protein [Thermoanaerobaculaceae bacterium]|nr:DUF1634 domain-containing protein [Thermoanaerobaculaceae bacterium]